MIKTITDSIYIDNTPMDRMEDHLYSTYGNAVNDIKITAKIDNFSVSGEMTDCTGKVHQLQFTHGTDYMRFDLDPVDKGSCLSYYSESHDKDFELAATATDLFIQILKDGSIITYTPLQLYAMAQYMELWDNSTICQNSVSSSTLCVPVAIFSALLKEINY